MLGVNYNSLIFKNTKQWHFNIVWTVSNVKRTKMFINQLHAHVNNRPSTRFDPTSGHLQGA